VTKTIIKKYNAEIHSQAAIEGLLELKQEHGFRAEAIEWIEIDIFDVAYNIIGGGEEGDKTIVRTKEEADHSLHYMAAVALLDSQVLPDQYRPERILQDDVQTLLRKVTVRRDETCSHLFPEQHACRLVVAVKDGQTFSKGKRDYEGFHTRPMGWEGVKRKFDLLTGDYLDNRLRTAIADAVTNLEDITVADLTELLARVNKQQ
jgi:2-methylcitrate dehydratase